MKAGHLHIANCIRDTHCAQRQLTFWKRTPLILGGSEVALGLELEQREGTEDDGAARRTCARRPRGPRPLDHCSRRRCLGIVRSFVVNGHDHHKPEYLVQCFQD